MTALEDALDRVFAVPLEAFVRERDLVAKGLRGAGEASAAASVKALRKPSVPAWLLNRLARSHPAELAAFLSSAEALRGAQRQALQGHGAEALRGATRAEREAVAALVRLAASVLSDGGRAVPAGTLDRVAATLHGAATSQRAGELLRRGWLQHELDPAGFGDLADEDGLLEAATPIAPAEAPAVPVRPPGPKVGAKLAAGRAALQRAARDAADREKSAAAAEEALRQAHERLQAAEQEAREAASAAEQAARAAQEAARASDEAAVRLDRALEQLEQATRTADEVGLRAHALREEADAAAERAAEAEQRSAKAKA